MRCAERTLDVLSIPSFLRKSDQNCLEKEKKKNPPKPFTRFTFVGRNLVPVSSAVRGGNNAGRRRRRRRMELD